MPVDKFGRSPETLQNVTNVAGVSHEYVNSNFLRKGQAIDISGQSIVNLGKAQGPKDAVRRKYVNERFFKKGDLIDMNQKITKNVLPPTEDGDAAMKGGQTGGNRSRPGPWLGVKESGAKSPKPLYLWHRVRFIDSSLRNLPYSRNAHSSYLLPAHLVPWHKKICWKGQLSWYK